MRSPDVVRVIVSPCSAHSLRFSVCDLKHKVAVWQGYVLILPVTCTKLFTRFSDSGVGAVVNGISRARDPVATDPSDPTWVPQQSLPRIPSRDNFRVALDHLTHQLNRIWYSGEISRQQLEAYRACRLELLRI